MKVCPGECDMPLIVIYIFALNLQPCLSRFSNVYFVDASTTETIITDLRNIALAKEIGESWEDTLDWLAMQHEEWLLLLNNADDTTFNIRDYFPDCSHGNIMVTSRNPEIVQHNSDVRSCCHVSGMNASDAKKLLLNISGLRERRDKETEATAAAIVKVHFTVV